MTMQKLRAPFPYYGFKGRVAPIVWERLGQDVANYVEPFCGSAAVLLQRPGGQQGTEVLNDKSGAVVNFWRAVRDKPDEVVKYAVTIKAESELHARNAYVRNNLPELTARLEGDPEHSDAKIAGYWCYVQCNAIGEAAFARGPWIVVDGKLVHRGQAEGIRRTIPCNMDRGIQKAIPFHGLQGLMAKIEFAAQWMRMLHDRLAGVAVICGDWSRALKPTYTTQQGVTGVFLDKPYDTHYKCYASSDPMTKKVYEWCMKHGDDPMFRIALCGYDGEFPPDLVGSGWTEYAWKAPGGRVTPGGDSDKNREKERIYFSPHCLSDDVGQMDLFGEAV